MKAIVPAILLLLPSVWAAARPIDPDAARETAARHLSACSGAKGIKEKASRIAASLTLQAESEAAYLFSDPRGRFVLAASDDRLPSVLGYGFRGGEEMPPALRGLMAAYGKALRLSEGAVTFAAIGETVPVEPLLTSVRHQTDPYNRCCPFYRYADGSLSEQRCVVGCVATALEEAISYHRRVVTLQDTLHGWSTEHYDLPDVLPGTSVDTRLIIDDYARQTYTPEQADAVARLSFYCGMAARMNWGVSESGARLEHLVEPLRRAFGFGYVHYADSYKYDPDEWVEMLDREIRSGRPVVYTAFGMEMNGHAFVLDGRDGDGFFHVNWGVDGLYDGYYRIDVLNPGDQKDLGPVTDFAKGFICNHEALFFHPDAVEVALPDTLARTGREIVVDSIRFEQLPETGKLTPFRVYFRNTSDKALTTPLEFFTNLPTDTALFEQGEYVALAGIRLAPGERADRLVHARFSYYGSRVLRLSPDDVNILCELPIYVNSHHAPALAFPQPAVSFPAAGTVLVRQEVDNAGGVGRAGHKVLFELRQGEGEDGEYVGCQTSYTYLPAGEAETLEARFTGLVAGLRYTVLVRCPWEVKQTLGFTMPEETTGIGHVGAEPAAASWHTPDGRRLARPASPGLYLRTRAGRTEKVFVR